MCALQEIDNPQSVKSVSPCYLSTLSVMSSTGLSNSSDSDVPSVNSNSSTINNVITQNPPILLPPPMGPLMRQIGEHKWNYGKEKFRRLHNVYNILRILKYVIVNLMFLYNVFIMRKMTSTEAMLYWVYNPMLIFIAILFMQKIMIFHKYPKISYNSFQKLSHYPGYSYDYGLLIAAKYPINVRDISYEYWIAHNKTTGNTHYVTISNHNYDIPYLYDE